MKEVFISAKTQQMDEAVEIPYQFPEDIDEATEAYGDAVVYSAFLSSVTIDAQAFIRRCLRAEKSVQQITEELGNWKPGVRMVQRKSRVEKVKGLWDEMTDEEKRAMLEQLQAA